MGKVIEVDCKAIKTNKAWFLRVRVEVPLDKPLRRGGLVVSPEGDEARVVFRYERLVGWCFACGRLGHELKESKTASKEDKNEKPYGEWLKAGSRVRPETLRRHQKSPEQQWSNFNAETASTPVKPKNSDTVLPVPTHQLQQLKSTINPISSPNTLLIQYPLQICYLSYPLTQYPLQIR